eukprot:TRINITY_DN968_c0_g1_i1.p1 TRINITY_DN968_c0_g1~~TRINITY_DN968_c0_g1_i1.p1  ORF type:complete len:190 (+),score=50.48 TRINITY_DN968_c0_g1_i1:91-660(+)
MRRFRSHHVKSVSLGVIAESSCVDRFNDEVEKRIDASVQTAIRNSRERDNMISSHHRRLRSQLNLRAAATVSKARIVLTQFGGGGRRRQPDSPDAKLSPCDEMAALSRNSSDEMLARNSSDESTSPPPDIPRIKALANLNVGNDVEELQEDHDDDDNDAAALASPVSPVSPIVLKKLKLSIVGDAAQDD